MVICWFCIVSDTGSRRQKLKRMVIFFFGVTNYNHSPPQKVIWNRKLDWNNLLSNVIIHNCAPKMKRIAIYAPNFFINKAMWYTQTLIFGSSKCTCCCCLVILSRLVFLQDSVHRKELVSRKKEKHMTTPPYSYVTENFEVIDVDW